MSRSLQGRRIVALGAMMCLGLTSFAARAAGGPEPLCARPVRVYAVGDAACPVPGGYMVRTADGARLITHGPDIAAADQVTRLRATPLKPSCVSDPNYQPNVRVLYVSVLGGPTRYSTMAREIRQMVYVMNGALDAEARRSGVRMSFRVFCRGSDVAVDNVPVLVSVQDPNYIAIVNAVRQKGYTNPFTRYLIWADQRAGGLGGVANREADDRAMVTNDNNFGAAYTVVFGRRLNDGGLTGPATMLHELGHNFGAVQESAPHTTGAGHCNDGLDVMCYNDNGTVGRYTDEICSGAPIDCRKDDYFNPRPRRGSYLATHWNLASPFNRWIRGCGYSAGSLLLPGAGQSAVSAASVSFALSSSCWGHPFAVSAVSKATIDAFRTIGGGPVDNVAPPDWILAGWRPGAEIAPPDVNICFYKRSVVLRCHTAVGGDAGVVPSGTTSARVSLHSGANAAYVFNAI